MRQAHEAKLPTEVKHGARGVESSDVLGSGGARGDAQLTDGAVVDTGAGEHGSVAGGGPAVGVGAAVVGQVVGADVAVQALVVDVGEGLENARRR